MQLYLITGFLGAGKTTFLKKFVNILSDKRLYLIINEFGKEGVDGTLLEEMQVTLAEINNGSIFCACRLDKFEEELKKAISENPEVIIVEASGLSDPTNIRKVLAQKQYAYIDYKGSICLVDATRFEKVYQTARVVPKQLAVSSLALLNKTDLASREQISMIEQYLRHANPAIIIKRTVFGEIEKQWLEYLTPDIDVEEAINTQDITLQKALITIDENMKLKQLLDFLNMISEDTYRIKGFVGLEGKLMLVDGVGSYIKLVPFNTELTRPKSPASIGGGYPRAPSLAPAGQFTLCQRAVKSSMDSTNIQRGLNPQLNEVSFNGCVKDENKIIALAGKGMSLRKALKNACEWYYEYIKEIEF